MSTSRFAAAGDRPIAPEQEPSDRSILIGIVATLLFHVLLVVLAPRFTFDDFSGIHSGITVTNQNQGKTFDFELADEVKPQEKQRNPFQFVETNPDAPENEPDKTDNFSNRNQQSAQMEKPKELDPLHRPAIDQAQDEIKNDTAVVTGDMAQPQNGANTRPERDQTAEADQQEQKLRMLQTPDAGFEKLKGDSPDGISSDLSRSKAPSTNASQEVEGSANSKNPDGSMVEVTATQKAQPKARPKLTAARSTILTNRLTGVSNLGITGMDARWSEYGEYLQELIEIVQAQWYRILDESRIMPPRGSSVAVTFKINARGDIEVVKVEDEGAGRQAVFSCQNAIQARQPYRKWSEQMIATLGEEQTLTFKFYHR